MNDSTNPYRPPIDLAKTRIVADLNWHELPNQRLHFTFQLTPADVHRCVVPRQSFWLPLALALVTLLLLIVSVDWSAVGGFAMQPGLLFPVGFLWALFVFVVLLQRLISKQSIAQAPTLLDSTTGYINAKGIFAGTNHGKGFSKWESVRRITLNDRCATLSTDSWRQIEIILPWNAFEDPAAARGAMESVSKQITVDMSLALDERLRLPPDDEPMFHPPQGHVIFCGEIKIGVITEAAVGKRLRRTIRRMLIVCGIGIVLACATILLGWLYFAFVGLPISIFASWLMIRVFRHPLYNADPDTVAFRLEGWFAEREYFVHTFTSQYVRDYAELQACTLDDTMISVRIPSSVDAWQFFPRSMFSDVEDFRQVSQWLESAVTVEHDGRDQADHD